MIFINCSSSNIGDLLDPVDNDKCIRQPDFHWMVGGTYLCDQDRYLEKEKGDFCVLDMNGTKA